MKYTLSLVFGLFCTICAYAEVISPAEALQRVSKNGVNNTKVRSLFQNGDASLMRLCYTGTADADPVYYVFESKNPSFSGFVFLSADTEANAVLGYVENVSWPGVDKLPVNMRDFLDGYVAEINSVRKSAAFNSSGRLRVMSTRPERADISPVIKTKWDQDAPFNNLCPKADGENTYTGCVATAMAQVMKYHNWPPKGSGIVSYKWGDAYLSLNIGKSTYDWDNMLDDYSGTYTDSQADAVATLMRDCGYSVSMDYGTSASGAYSENVAGALLKYFDYDASLSFYHRQYFSLYEWESMIYEQLESVGPVYFSGSNDSAGHAFVCDGYEGDGFFHFNWGWSGISDGYFLLTALDPDNQGVGGSTAGYSMRQGCLIGARPDCGGSVMWRMASYDALTTSSSSIVLGDYLTFKGLIYNESLANISGEFGAKFVGNNGNERVVDGGSPFSDLQYGYGYTSAALCRVPLDLESGTYSVYPVFRVSGESEWRDVEFPVSASSYLVVSVNNGAVSISQPQYSADLSAGDVQLKTPLYELRGFQLTASVANEGNAEYYGYVRPVLCEIVDNTSLNPVAYGQSYTLNLAPGETHDMVYNGSFSYLPEGASYPAPGEYAMCIIDGNGYVISELLWVQLKENDAVEPKCTVSGLRFADGNSSAVDWMHMNITANAVCTAGYIDDSLWMYIYPVNDEYSVGYIASSVPYIEKGESKAITFKGAIPSAKPKTDYVAYVAYSGIWVCDPLYFTTAEGSAVENVSVDGNHDVSVTVRNGFVEVKTNDADGVAELYDMYGKKVASANVACGTALISVDGVPHGVYVVRASGVVGSSVCKVAL